MGRLTLENKEEKMKKKVCHLDGIGSGRKVVSLWCLCTWGTCLLTPWIHNCSVFIITIQQRNSNQCNWNKNETRKSRSMANQWSQNKKEKDHLFHVELNKCNPFWSTVLCSSPQNVREVVLENQSFRWILCPKLGRHCMYWDTENWVNTELHISMMGESSVEILDPVDT